jgi:hypothetical protein
MQYRSREGRGPVGEDVAEVSVAHRAHRLDTHHAVALVPVVADDAGRDGRREARPPGAAIELVRGVEEGRVAASAVVAPRLEHGAHRGRVRPLGPGEAHDLELLGREPRAPLVGRELDARGRRWTATFCPTLDVAPGGCFAGVRHEGSDGMPRPAFAPHIGSCRRLPEPQGQGGASPTGTGAAVAIPGGRSPGTAGRIGACTCRAYASSGSTRPATSSASCTFAAWSAYTA